MLARLGYFLSFIHQLRNLHAAQLNLLATSIETEASILHRKFNTAFFARVARRIGNFQFQILKSQAVYF